MSGKCAWGPTWLFWWNHAARREENFSYCPASDWYSWFEPAGRDERWFLVGLSRRTWKRHNAFIIWWFCARNSAPRTSKKGTGKPIKDDDYARGSLQPFVGLERPTFREWARNVLALLQVQQKNVKKEHCVQVWARGLQTNVQQKVKLHHAFASSHGSEAI